MLDTCFPETATQRPHARNPTQLNYLSPRHRVTARKGPFSSWVLSEVLAGLLDATGRGPSTIQLEPCSPHDLPGSAGASITLRCGEGRSGSLEPCGSETNPGTARPVSFQYCSSPDFFAVQPCPVEGSQLSSDSLCWTIGIDWGPEETEFKPVVRTAQCVIDVRYPPNHADFHSWWLLERFVRLFGLLWPRHWQNFD
jgi:hypothetical protein